MYLILVCMLALKSNFNFCKILSDNLRFFHSVFVSTLVEKRDVDIFDIIFNYLHVDIRF